MFHVESRDSVEVLHLVGSVLSPLGVTGVELFKDPRIPGVVRCTVQGLHNRSAEFNPWSNVGDACLVFRALKAHVNWGCSTRVLATITRGDKQVLARLPAKTVGYSAHWDQDDSRIHNVPIECALAMSLLLSIGKPGVSISEFYLKLR